MHLRAAGSAFRRSMQVFMAGRSRKWSSRRPTVAVSRPCPSTNSTVISKARAAGMVRAMALSVVWRCSYPTVTPPGFRPGDGGVAMCAPGPSPAFDNSSRAVADLARGTGCGQRERRADQPGRLLVQRQAPDGKGVATPDALEITDAVGRGGTAGSGGRRRAWPGRRPPRPCGDPASGRRGTRRRRRRGPRRGRSNARSGARPHRWPYVVREEVSEGKGEGNAEQRGEPIGEDELQKGDSRDPHREEGSRAKAGDVTSRHDGLHGVPAIRDLEAALAVGGEEEPHGAPPEHSLSAIASRPVQDHVARKRSQEAHEQPRPGGHEPFVTHHAGGDDRHLLGNGQPEASREKDEVDPEIGELLDERLNRLHELPQAASRVPATEGTPDGGNRLLSRRDGTKGPGRFFAFPTTAPGSRSSSIDTDARG